VTYSRGCGFRGLFGETPVMGLFTSGSVPRKTPNIWLTYVLDNTTSFGI
jgi:hypothetical protein